LEKIKEFFYDISQLSKFEKIFNCGDIKEKFQEIIREFDSCVNDLNLAISITTNEQMNKYLKILHSDTTEMKKFLNNVEDGITSIDNKIDGIEKHLEKIVQHKSPKLNKEIDDIHLLNEQVNSNQNLKLKAKQIDPSELKDSSQFIACKGSRVTI